MYTELNIIKYSIISDYKEIVFIILFINFICSTIINYQFFQNSFKFVIGHLQKRLLYLLFVIMSQIDKYDSIRNGADSSAIKYNDDMLYTRMCMLACMCIPYMQKRENTRRNTLECYGSNTSHRKRTIGPLAQFVRFFSRLYICAVNRNSISRRCVAGSRKWWISKVHTYIVFDGDIQPRI